MLPVFSSVCQSETLLCVASDITLSTEMIRTLKVSDWKKESIDNEPCYTVGAPVVDSQNLKGKENSDE